MDGVVVGGGADFGDERWNTGRGYRSACGNARCGHAGGGGDPAQPQLPPDLAAAEAAFRKGNFADALKALQEAVKKDPDQPPAQSIMAQMFARRRWWRRCGAPWNRR